MKFIYFLENGSLEETINKWLDDKKPKIIQMTHAYSRGMGTTICFLYEENV